MLDAQMVEIAPEDLSAITELIVGLHNDLSSLAPRHLCPVPGHEDEFDRTRAIAALGSVLKFCRAVGIPGESREPLFALQAALTDASRGLSSKMLEAVPGSPSMAKKPYLTAMDDAMAVAALDILVEGGIKPKRAVPALAKALGCRASRLEAMRKDFKSGRAKQEDLDQFEYWKKDWKQRRAAGMAAKGYVEALISIRGFKGSNRLDL